MTSDAVVVPLTGTAVPDRYSALHAGHLESLLRFAWLLCGDRHQAEDVVAEAVAKVFPQWRRGQVYDPSAYLRRAGPARRTGSWSARSGRLRQAPFLARCC